MRRAEVDVLEARLTSAVDHGGFSRHFPKWGTGAVLDHGGMRRGAAIGLAGRFENRSHEFAERVANSDALKIGQTHRAVFAPAGTNGMWKREHCCERSRLVFDRGDEALCDGVKLGA